MLTIKDFSTFIRLIRRDWLLFISCRGEEGGGVRGTGLSLFKITWQSIFYILPLNYIGED